MGRNMARLAQLGRKHLDSLGLGGINTPGSRGEMCASCACRAGTVPNGCLQTQLDILKAVVEGAPFLCHAPRDGRMCAGYIAARAQQVADPLPPEAVALISKWQYSPPDETA
jgi:hypothetical protein